MYYNLILLRRSYMLLGKVDEALAASRALIAFGEQTGNVLFRASGEFGVATVLAYRGEVCEAIDHSKRFLDLTSDRFSPLHRPVALVSHGHFLLQASLYADARKVLDEAIVYLAKNRWYTDWVLPAYALQAESILGPTWADPVQKVDGRDLALARQLVRWSTRAGIAFPNLVPQTLRVGARVAWACGDRKKAVALFHQSIARGESQFIRYELARALLDASRVILDRADEYRLRGQQLLDELGAVVPQAERFFSQADQSA